MTELFKKCLYADYTESVIGGDYAIEVEGNILYLLFQCSVEVEDWRNNFDFPAVPYKHTKEKWRCHRGFLRVWKAMRNEIDIKIAEILSKHPEINTIVCVGYSHGGALCLLATEEMEYLYGEKYDVFGYGFAAPRVIFGKVPKEVKKRLANFHLIRNMGDIVTHLPPLLFGFRTVGIKQTVGKLGKYSPIKAHYAEAYMQELKNSIDTLKNM